MRIGKFRKGPADRKRYVVNYADWLNEDEILSEVTLVGNIPEDDFFVDGYIINEDGKEVVFFVSGGIAGASYDVTITITTSIGQIKEDWITFTVTQ